MRPAIVLGNGDGVLGVIHSLAKTGITVLHVFTNPREFAHHSRFVRHSFLAPPPDQGTGLLRLLLRIGERRGDAFLIPCGEDALVLYVARHRDALLSRYKLTVPPEDILERLLDKSALYRHALEAGIPVPKTRHPESIEELKALRDELTYPCLLKPAESYRFFAAYGKKLVIARDAAELERAFTDASRRGITTMVTELVPGGDSNLYHYRSYIDGKGRVLAEMCTRKLRQHPAGFGVACFSRTVNMIPGIREHALSLLRRVGYSGVSSAEFKRDARDGRFNLMEVNVRPVLPERLFAEAGINFSAVAYRDAMGFRQSAPPDCETGVYWVHNFLETIRLLYHRDLALRDYLTPYTKRRLITCVPFLRDPVPFLGRLWKTAVKALGVAVQRKAR